MNNDNYKPNYEHFADIVALAVGRVLQNERKKGSNYSFETFCVNIEYQIGSHFGINPQEFFTAETAKNNYIDFAKDVVELFEKFQSKNGRRPRKEACKTFYEDIITIMHKHNIEIINDEDYWQHWSNDDNSKKI